MSNRAQIFVRIFADAVLLILASLIGLTISYTWQDLDVKLLNYLQANLWMTGLLLAIAIPTFYISGFYSKGRAYSSTYKPVFVLQISLLAFLIWSFVLFLVEKNMGSARIGLISTAIVGVALLVGARIWSRVWKLMNSQETSTGSLLSSEKSFSDKPNSVLVIGGAGYIGSGLMKKLLDRGYRVRLVDAFMFGEAPIANILSHPNLEVVRSDFRQIDVIVQAMRGIDAVVHLGAIVGDPACALDEDFTIEVNLMATRMIAECAKGSGVKKFVFASTCSVYGASDQLLDEHSHLNPVSLYARSKIACERILTELTTDTFRPTILRFGTVYGLSGRTRFDLVVNLLTAKAIVDRKITVFGADQWRPFVHVDDAALAVATALESPIEVAGGEIFNVGSDEGNLTLGDIGHLIKRLVPEAELIESGSDSDRRNYRVNFSKIRNHLGFRPAWTVEMGVKQVIEAFASGQVSDYHATKYSNVKYLTEEAQRSGLRNDSQRMKALVDDPMDSGEVLSTAGVVIADRAVVESK